MVARRDEVTRVQTGITTAPLVAIVGQTASGKTALALELAERFGGEIICADSRTVYRGMDIGTAKPTTSERAKIAHHCIDLVNPDETFSVAQFKTAAQAAMDDIHKRGKLPIMVGGTGLYIDAVLFDYEFGNEPDYGLRAELSEMTIDELQKIIEDHGYTMPENNRNKRYLIRTIERHGERGNHKALRPNTLVIGLTVDTDTLKKRIAQRVDNMLSNGFVDEYKRLRKKYAPGSPGLLAPGYKAFANYIEGDDNIDEAKAVFVKNDYHLAKRQRTWFKRNPSVQWVDDQSKAVDIVTTFLNN